MSNNDSVHTCCFLSRTHRYIFECLLENKERSQALCPHLFPMTQNAHLGATFLASKREQFMHVPYKAEFFSYGQDHKIFCDLPEIFSALLESIDKNECDHLKDLEPIPGFTLSSVIGPQDLKIEFLDKEQETSFLLIQPIFSSDPLGRGFFPQEITPWTLDFLIDAISHQQSGHQSIILFLGLNTAIESIHPAHHIDAEYSRLLKEARACGVQILSALTNYDQHQDVHIEFNQIFEFDQQSL